MFDPSRYFDHAATTPLLPEAFEAMRPWLEATGNPHSLHGPGRAARAAVEQARESVCEVLRLEDPSQVVFTSGATEACNWALSLAGADVAISPFEHSAVREPALARGARILPNDGFALLPAKAEFAAVMSVNNETGALLDPRPVEAGRLLVDATQAVGKVPVDGLAADFTVLSAHKLGGPVGVGALLSRDPLIAPWQLGGEQEDGRRAGTLNVAGIVGLATALRIAVARREEHASQAAALRAQVLESLDGLPGLQVHDHVQQSPFILSLSFAGVEGETLVVELDNQGFAASAGAACSSRRTEPSHVLTALGVPKDLLRGTLRLSFGRSNTLSSAGALAYAVRQTVQVLRKM